MQIKVEQYIASTYILLGTWSLLLVFVLLLQIGLKRANEKKACNKRMAMHRPCHQKLDHDKSFFGWQEKLSSLNSNYNYEKSRITSKR